MSKISKKIVWRLLVFVCFCKLLPCFVLIQKLTFFRVQSCCYFTTWPPQNSGAPHQRLPRVRLPVQYLRALDVWLVSQLVSHGYSLFLLVSRHWAFRSNFHPNRQLVDMFDILPCKSSLPICSTVQSPTIRSCRPKDWRWKPLEGFLSCDENKR